jgi:hypothetical protein
MSQMKRAAESKMRRPFISDFNGSDFERSRQSSDALTYCRKPNHRIASALESRPALVK